MIKEYKLKDLLDINPDEINWSIEKICDGKKAFMRLTMEENYETRIYISDNNEDFEWLATYSFSEDTDCRLHEVMEEATVKELTKSESFSVIYIASSGSN